MLVARSPRCVRLALPSSFQWAQTTDTAARPIPLSVASFFPSLFCPPLRFRFAWHTVPEGPAGRCKADLTRRHDVAAQYIQQLHEPALYPHVAYVRNVDVDPHFPFNERRMRHGEQRVDVDGLRWIDRLLWSAGLALQYVQQLPEPQRASHLPH